MLNKVVLAMFLVIGPLGCAAIFGLDGDPKVAADASPGQNPDGSPAAPPDAGQPCGAEMDCPIGFSCSNGAGGFCFPIVVPDGGFFDLPDSGTTSSTDGGSTFLPDAG